MPTAVVSSWRRECDWCRPGGCCGATIKYSILIILPSWGGAHAFPGGSLEPVCVRGAHVIPSSICWPSRLPGGRAAPPQDRGGGSVGPCSSRARLAPSAGPSRSRTSGFYAGRVRSPMFFLVVALSSRRTHAFPPVSKVRTKIQKRRPLESLLLFAHYRTVGEGSSACAKDCTCVWPRFPGAPFHRMFARQIPKFCTKRSRPIVPGVTTRRIVLCDRGLTTASFDEA